jgi:hypothetical protein
LGGERGCRWIPAEEKKVAVRKDSIHHPHNGYKINFTAKQNEEINLLQNRMEKLMPNTTPMTS